MTAEKITARNYASICLAIMKLADEEFLQAFSRTLASLGMTAEDFLTITGFTAEFKADMARRIGAAHNSEQ